MAKWRWVVDAGGFRMTFDQRAPGKSVTEALWDSWVGDKGKEEASAGQPLVLQRKSRVYFTTVPRNRYMDLSQVTREIVMSICAAHKAKGIYPPLLAARGDVLPS